MKKECNPVLKPFIPVVCLLGEMLGKNYEIALHDVSGPEPFLVEHVNGEVTGRSDSSPMTDLGDFLMNSPEAAGVEYLANYLSEAENGRKLRSGVSLIRDGGGELVGFLCINYDVTNASLLKDLGDFLTHAEPLRFAGVKTERFQGARDPETLLEMARRKFGKPLKFLTSEERKSCIRFLDEEGFFNFKGAVDGLSKEMAKSRYTLYADIRALRLVEKDASANGVL